MLKTSLLLWIVLLFQAVKTMELQKGVTVHNVEINSGAEDGEKVKEGSSITLTCSANIVIPPDHPSQVLYLFYKGKNKDVLLKNITGNGQESHYTIQSARASHSGYYHCVVEVGRKREESKTFITVTGKLQRPVLTVHPREVTVGNSTNLRCEILEELPPLTFIFYKHRYQTRSRLTEIKENKNFAIYPLKVTESTEESYSCSCSVHGIDKGSLSNHSEIVQYTVRVPVSTPVLSSEPNNNILKKGQALTLKCTVSKGSFPINYKFFNGSIIHNTSLNSTEAKYLINSVNSGSDYYCKASNAATSHAEESNHIPMRKSACSQVAVPVAWILVTTLLLSVSTICSN
ncbi:platelet endothelial cell adhesion molecule-like [Heterodontus francisci]|uniref:platelet endothelial cell adhesion molecule-like n=1 Tax=Heterodontus francisci TaxID=7792 RepID=UPI00355AE5BD